MHSDHINRKLILVTGWSLVAVHLLGILFPETWWTTHFLAFLAPVWKIGFPIVAAGLVFAQYRFGRNLFPEESKRLTGREGVLVASGVALVMGVLMYAFPMIYDYYGDAYKVLNHLENIPIAIPDDARKALFAFGLSPWDGHTSVLALITYVAYYGEISYRNGYYVVNIFSGVAFSLTWLLFVFSYFTSRWWQIVMALVGIGSPFMLIYFGHFESYALPFWLILLALVMMVWFVETKDKRLLWCTIPVLLLAIKTHTVSLLLVPSVAMLFIDAFSAPDSLLRRQLTWKGVGLWVFLPVTLAGMVLYFFILGDHADPRDLNTLTLAFDRLFLPLVSPEPPLDRYNMFSMAHVFDYAVMTFKWSSAGLLVLFVILSIASKEIDWGQLAVLAVGTSFVLFSAIFFVVNPLLSMQLDWDMMCLPAPAFLVLIALCVKQVQAKVQGRDLVLTVVAGVLLTLPMYMVHRDTDATSYRLESLGKRMFHTYYVWADQAIGAAQTFPNYDAETYTARKDALVQELRPFAKPGIDYTFSRLITEDGRNLLRVSNRPDLAIPILEDALYYYPDRNATLYLMESYFLVEDFERALSVAERLVELQFPSESKSIAIALHCALEAGLEDEARKYANHYVANWDDRPMIRDVQAGLDAGVPLKELAKKFSTTDEQ